MDLNSQWWSQSFAIYFIIMVNIIYLCDKVVISNGRLGGYGGGIARIEQLLQHEPTKRDGSFCLESAKIILINE